MLRSRQIIFVFLGLLLVLYSLDGTTQEQPGKLRQLSSATTARDSLSILLQQSVLYRYNDPGRSITLALAATELAVRLNDVQSLSQAHISLGDTYYETGDYRNALENYSSALNRCVENYDPLFVARCLSNIGRVYRELGAYALSISKFEEAGRLYLAEDDQTGLVRSKYNLGTTYCQSKDYDQAMQYFNEVLDYGSDVLQDKLRAATYKNIGNLFSERGESHMAREFYNRAMTLYELLDDKKSIASMHFKRGQLYLLADDHEAALGQLLLASEGFDSLQNRKRLAWVNLSIAEIYMLRHDNRKAAEHINLAISSGHEHNLTQVLRESYFLLYQLHSLGPDLHKALEYYALYTAINDAILSEDLINTIARTETRNTFSQHEINIDHIEREKQFQKYTRWFALTITILALLIVLLAFSRLINQRKANRVLAHQRNILKETLSDLKLNEEKYKALFSQANDAIFLMDKETFTDCNDKTLAIFGCERSEIVGHPPYRFSPKKQPDGRDSKEKAIELIKQCYRGNPQRFYWLHSRLDGSSFDAEVSLNIVTLKDRRYIQAIVRDISDKVRAEKEMVQARDKAEKATESKTFFLAKMSHEIRTILGGITSASELLKGTKVDRQQSEFVDIINTSADNLLGIVNEILDMSKIEAGKVEIEKRPFNLKSSLENTVNTYLPKAREKNISLYLSIHPKLPEFVSGDELRLRQILNNLLSNAIKFTDKGSVTLDTEVVKEYANSYIISLKVSDTGIGIPDSKAKDMFAEYSQMDVSISRKYGGTGLGLNIVYKLIKLLNGSIEVSSKLNEGTSFYINLPVEKAKTEDGIVEEKKIPLKKRRKYHILLAEDNKVNQKITLINLENLGYTVEIAENGDVAWGKYLDQTFDVILMDIQMPGKDGIEVTRMIRDHERKHPEIKRTRIIALTANILDQDAEYCLSQGMDAFIGKPFRIEDIIEQLDGNGNKPAG